MHDGFYNVMLDETCHMHNFITKKYNIFYVILKRKIFGK